MPKSIVFGDFSNSSSPFKKYTEKIKYQINITIKNEKILSIINWFGEGSPKAYLEQNGFLCYAEMDWFEECNQLYSEPGKK